MTTATEISIDVDEAGFAARVLDESRRRPVVVDFWAEWCGPCRTLGPTLERLAEESGGRFLLARVDVDRNQELAMQFRVQGIPAVKVFQGGEVVDEFVGALPEGEVRRFLENIVPGPADELADAGEKAAAAGDAIAAEAAFERALQLRARHGRSLLGLARLDLAAGDADSAERRLDQIPPADADRLTREIGALRLALRGGGASSADLAARVKADPEDDAARVAFGNALAAEGRHEEALAELLTVVKRRHREGPGDEARQAMLAVFEAAGARSELSDRYRSLLAAELYR